MTARKIDRANFGFRSYLGLLVSRYEFGAVIINLRRTAEGHDHGGHVKMRRSQAYSPASMSDFGAAT